MMPRGPKGEKRPADVIGNAVRVMEIATSEREEEFGRADEAKHNTAAELGRRGGEARAKVENHAHSVALHSVYDYFVRIHGTLRMTPATAAGVSDRLWEIADILALLKAAEAEKARQRGSYVKRGERAV